MARKRYSIPFEFGTSKGDFGFIAEETTYDPINTELGVNDVTDAELKNVLMNLDADDIQIGKIRGSSKYVVKGMRSKSMNTSDGGDGIDFGDAGDCDGGDCVGGDCD